MVASRLIKRERGSLPVDVRRSKTLLLKFPNFSELRTYLCGSVFDFLGPDLEITEEQGTAFDQQTHRPQCDSEEDHGEMYH